VIVSNQAECLKCGDKPFSAHRHDFKRCECGEIAVDGGDEYLRRLGNPNNMKDMSIIVPESLVSSLIEATQEAIDTKRNSRGIVYAILRRIRDDNMSITYTDNSLTLEAP